VLNAEGKPEPRKVETGINNNAIVEVLSGLKPGETVVVGEASASPMPAGAPNQRGPRMRML
jgi:membrane fusion protein, macrolide-specific efflux system